MRSVLLRSDSLDWGSDDVDVQGRHRRLLPVMAAEAMTLLAARLSWGSYGPERLFDATPSAFAHSGNLDRADFWSQSGADPSDPNGLDADGEACEEFDYGSGSGQYQDEDSDDGRLSQYRYGWGSDALIESGGLEVGHVPTLSGGGCPPQYPTDGDGACWR